MKSAILKLVLPKIHIEEEPDGLSGALEGLNAELQPAPQGVCIIEDTDPVADILSSTESIWAEDSETSMAQNPSAAEIIEHMKNRIFVFNKPGTKEVAQMHLHITHPGLNMDNVYAFINSLPATAELHIFGVTDPGGQFEASALSGAIRETKAKTIYHLICTSSPIMFSTAVGCNETVVTPVTTVELNHREESIYGSSLTDVRNCADFVTTRRNEALQDLVSKNVLTQNEVDEFKDNDKTLWLFGPAAVERISSMKAVG